MRNFCNALRSLLVCKDEAQLMMHAVFFLCLLTFPLSGMAQERTFGNGILPELLSMYDVNGSGGLDQEELQALSLDRKDRRNRLRNRWDSNRDGRISDQEREAAKAAIKRQIDARRSLRFDEVDHNADGFLNQEEFNNIAAVDVANDARPGVSVDLYNNLDADNDGKVSKEEFLRKLNSIPAVVDPARLPKPHPKNTDVAPSPAPVPAR